MHRFNASDAPWLVLPGTITLLAIATVGAATAAADGAPAVVAQLGGAMSNVVRQGDVAFVGIGPRLVTLDVREAARPRIVGDGVTLGGPIEHLALADNTLLASHRGLTSIDVSDPLRPAVLQSLPLCVVRTILDRDTAFALFSGNGCFPIERVIDISNPRAMTVVGELPPSSPRVDLSVNVLSATRLAYGLYNVFLQVLDIADPMATTKLGEVEIDGGAARLANDGRFLYLATNNGELLVFGLTGGIPSLVPVARLALGARPRDLVLDGEDVLVATDDGLGIVDVSRPTLPHLVGAVAVRGARSVTRIGDVAYVTGVQGLVLVDLGARAAPAVAGRPLPAIAEARDIASLGPDVALVAAGASGLAVVDRRDVDAPRLAGSSAAGFDAEHVVVDGDRAFVTGATFVSDKGAGRWRGELAIFDVADIERGDVTAAPALIGTLSYDGEGADIAVAGGFAYVATGLALHGPALTVIDVRSAAAPIVVNALGTGWVSSAVAVDAAGRRGYVVDQAYGLRALDLTDPSRPHAVGGVPFESQAEAHGLAIEGDRVFATASSRPIDRMFEDEWSQDVLPVDTSDPSALQALAFLQVRTWSKDLAVADGRLVIASGREIRRDIDPHNQLIVVPRVGAVRPVPSVAVDLPAVPAGVDVVGNRAWVADGAAGVIEVAIGTAPPDGPTPHATAPSAAVDGRCYLPVAFGRVR